MVTLAPDVAAAFPNADAVNEALRVILKAARKAFLRPDVSLVQRALQPSSQELPSLLWRKYLVLSLGQTERIPMRVSEGMARKLGLLGGLPAKNHSAVVRAPNRTGLVSPLQYLQAPASSG